MQAYIGKWCPGTSCRLNDRLGCTCISLGKGLIGSNRFFSFTLCFHPGCLSIKLPDVLCRRLRSELSRFLQCLKLTDAAHVQLLKHAGNKYHQHVGAKRMKTYLRVRGQHLNQPHTTTGFVPAPGSCLGLFRLPSRTERQSRSTSRNTLLVRQWKLSFCYFFFRGSFMHPPKTRVMG